MSSTEAVSAKLTMQLKGSTGYEADCGATITPAQWGDLNAVVHGKLTAREKQLVAALRDGRVAIDVLMARMIEVDPSFLPTRSPAWPALVAIKAALDVAEA